MRFVRYDVCRLVMFVGILWLLNYSIMFVAYDVCRIMAFVANYEVCHLKGLSQYPHDYGYNGPCRPVRGRYDSSILFAFHTMLRCLEAKKLWYT